MKTGFLEESPNVKSWIRLQSLIFTLLAIALAVLSVFKPVPFEIFLLIVVAAVVPKTVQFYGEAYADKINSKSL